MGFSVGLSLNVVITFNSNSIKDWTGHSGEWDVNGKFVSISHSEAINGETKQWTLGGGLGVGVQYFGSS